MSTWVVTETICNYNIYALLYGHNPSIAIIPFNPPATALLAVIWSMMFAGTNCCTCWATSIIFVGVHLQQTGGCFCDNEHMIALPSTPVCLKLSSAKKTSSWLRSSKLGCLSFFSERTNMSVGALRSWGVSCSRNRSAKRINSCLHAAHLSLQVNVGF